MASTSPIVVVLSFSMVALTTACETKIRIDPCNQNSAGECELDLGKVYVGRSADEIVTVENIKDEAVEVNPVRLGSEEFTVIPELPEVLAIDASEDAEYRIIFKPDETKSFSARIFFQGFPPPGSATTLKLVGEGVGLEAKGDLHIEWAGETFNDEVDERIRFRDRIAPVQLSGAQRERVRITNTDSRRIRLIVQCTNLGPANRNGYYILGIDSSGMQIGFDPSHNYDPIKFAVDLDGDDWIMFEIAFVPPRGKPDPYTGYIKVYERDEESRHFVHVGFSGKADDPPEEEGEEEDLEGH